MRTSTSVRPIGRDMFIYGSLGVLLGIALNVGVVVVSALDETGGTTRSSQALTAENDVIRHQLSTYSLRISELEAQTDRFRASGDELHALLHSSRVITTAGTRFTLATERPSHQPSLPVSIVFRASTRRGPK